MPARHLDAQRRQLAPQCTATTARTGPGTDTARGLDCAWAVASDRGTCFVAPAAANSRRLLFVEWSTGSGPDDYRAIVRLGDNVLVRGVAARRPPCFRATSGSAHRPSFAGRLSHKARRVSTFCAFVPSATESFRSRRSRSGRLRGSHEVGENGGCQIRTTALVCATASRHCRQGRRRRHRISRDRKRV